MHKNRVFRPLCLLVVALLGLGSLGCLDNDTNDSLSEDPPVEAGLASSADGTNPAAGTEAEEAGPSAGNPIPGLGVPGIQSGFLWKPVSESDGKLVVLLPSPYVGRVAMVSIVRDGIIVDVGRDGGVHNGNRPHYRFAGSGASYGNDIFTVADLTDGDRHFWHIPSGASRTEL
jgi:hypothetical protein